MANDIYQRCYLKNKRRLCRLFYIRVIPQIKTRSEITKAIEIRIKFLTLCFLVNAFALIQSKISEAISIVIPIDAHMTVNKPLIDKTLFIKSLAKSAGTLTIEKYPSKDGFDVFTA